MRIRHVRLQGKKEGNVPSKISAFNFPNNKIEYNACQCYSNDDPSFFGREVDKLFSTIGRSQQWEDMGIKQHIEEKQRQGERGLVKKGKKGKKGNSLFIHHSSFIPIAQPNHQPQVPPSSSQPKLPYHRNIPQDPRPANLATRTKGGARLSRPQSSVCRQVRG